MSTEWNARTIREHFSTMTMGDQSKNMQEATSSEKRYIRIKFKEPATPAEFQEIANALEDPKETEISKKYAAEFNFYAKYSPKPKTHCHDWETQFPADFPSFISAFCNMLGTGKDFPGKKEIEVIDSKLSQKFINLVKSIVLEKINVEYFAKRESYSNAIESENILIAMSGSDLHSVTDSVLSKFCEDGQFRCAFIQESIMDEFDEIICRRLRKASEEEKFHTWHEVVKNKVEKALKAGAKVKFFNESVAVIYDFLETEDFPPEPVLYIVPFRTASEAVKLSKNLPHFCGASVWGPDLALNLAIADAIPCGSVWIDGYDQEGIKCHGLHNYTKYFNRNELIAEIYKIDAVKETLEKIVFQLFVGESELQPIIKPVKPCNLLTIYWKKEEYSKPLAALIRAVINGWENITVISSNDDAQTIVKDFKQALPNLSINYDSSREDFENSSINALTYTDFLTNSFGWENLTYDESDNYYLHNDFFKISKNIWLPKVVPL